MADELAPPPVSHGPVFVTDRHMIAELGSPCPEFHVIVFRIYGKQLYEAFRTAGTGTLYSLATTDLDELYAFLREACPEGSGG